MTFPRIRATVRNFIARHLIADEPTPELSRLDRMDGLEHLTSADTAGVVRARARQAGADNRGRF